MLIIEVWWYNVIGEPADRTVYTKCKPFFVFPWSTLTQGMVSCHNMYHGISSVDLSPSRDPFKDQPYLTNMINIMPVVWHSVWFVRYHQWICPLIRPLNTYHDAYCFSKYPHRKLLTETDPYHCNRLISQNPQCIRQISHNAPVCNRNVLLQNGALWDMVLVHCGICTAGLLICVAKIAHLGMEWCLRGIHLAVRYHDMPVGYN